jgi:hypothetical protein
MIIFIQNYYHSRKDIRLINFIENSYIKSTNTLFLSKL